jgi:hypothetical protein
VIELAGVSMVYRSRGEGSVTVLADLNLRVGEGEFVTLLGIVLFALISLAEKLPCPWYDTSS